MSETLNCSRCGAPLPPDSPEGLCPRCLMALNLATQTEIPGEAGAAKAPPSPPLPVREVAKLFPQLEIIECLGRGGMGAVYKARQPRLDRFVALKILSPEKQGNPKFSERFEREARALARLHHPNIVAVYDFGEVQGNFYLLMEYVGGLTLRQLLQGRKLSPNEAIAIVPKICEALQYAHEQGIVHRDIKPENILMDKEGRVKIADFGIAKILGDNGSANLTAEQVIGTPHYMSPEQIEKPQTVDHRADIYSLGVVFYEMLTGELPLGKFQPPSKKVQIDVRLDDVVLRALEKEPERRYQQAGEVKTRVETIAATPASSGGGRVLTHTGRLSRDGFTWFPPWLGLCLASASGAQGLVLFYFWPHPPLLFVLYVLVLALAGILLGISQRAGWAGKAAIVVGVVNFMVWLAMGSLIKITGAQTAYDAKNQMLPAGGNPVQVQDNQSLELLAEQRPVVVETFPPAGARDVESGELEIRVRFSKDMADGSWSWTTAWENSTPVSVGPPHYLADHRTCVMKVRLEPGKTYAWWLNSDKFKDFTDVAARPAVPYLFSFQTK